MGKNLQNLPFSQALEFLMVGRRIRRDPWEGITWVTAGERNGYATIVDQDGDEWLPGASSLFSNDWEVLP